MTPTFTFAYAYLVSEHPCQEPPAPCLQLCQQPQECQLPLHCLLLEQIPPSTGQVGTWKSHFRFQRRNMKKSKVACSWKQTTQGMLTPEVAISLLNIYLVGGWCLLIDNHLQSLTREAVLRKYVERISSRCSQSALRRSEGTKQVESCDIREAA